MIKIITYKAEYKAASGTKLPIFVAVERVTRDRLIEDFYFPEKQKSWCTNCNSNGKGRCSAYDTRPCCPPRVRPFEKFKPKKYVYFIHLRLKISDYKKTYPKVPKSSLNFFLTSYVAMLFNVIGKRIAEQIADKGDLTLKISGCRNCSYKKQGYCREGVKPAVEGVGLHSSKICEEIFRSPIQWYGKGKEIKYISGLAGVYTSRELKPKELKKILIKTYRKWDDTNEF